MDVARTQPIVLWGPGGSGTSLYLTALVCWLSAEHQAPRFAVLPASDEAARWVGSRATPTADGLDVGPRAPAPPCAHDFRIYRLSSPNGPAERSAPIAELRVWRGLPSDERLPSQLEHDLRGALGIVVLVGDAPARRGSALARASMLLDDATVAAPVPLAACLTQTDRTPDAARRDAGRWLAERDAEGARALARRGERGAVFKISALGHAPRLRGDREILHAQPEPRGVLEPLRWILSSQVAA